MRPIIKLLETYDYGSFKELMLSMFPSWKYDLQNLTLVISALSGAISYLFGFGPALGIAMLAAVAVEVYTGIKASKVLGKPFESFKFSRCILKLALWAIIFYIVHAFENEYIARTNVFDILAYVFFKIVFLSTITMFLVEHLTSILENKSVIDGQPKTALIEVIQGFWKQFIKLLTDRFK